MSRGNAWDSRLDRMVQIALLFMEALQGFEHKFDFSLVGHSGGSADHLLLDYHSAVPSLTQKLSVVDTMYSTAGGAVSGDSSLDAITEAVQSVLEDEDADDYFVFVLSDANLGRYGITPQDLKQRILQHDQVKVCVLFVAEPIASEWLVKELPFGQAFACMDVGKLPGIVRDIFAHFSGLDDTKQE